MSETIKSFEFKKGVHLYYRYNTAGNMEVLWDKEWITLKKYVKDEYSNGKTYKEKQLLNKQK